MKIKFLIIFIVFLLLTACGQSVFEKSMRSGKDNLQNGNYKDAVKEFDIALIEKPSDKDANLLMERSKIQLDKYLSKEAFSTYQTKITDVYNEFHGIFLRETVTGRTAGGVFDKLENEEKINKIKSQIIEIGRKYNDYADVKSINNELEDAVDRISEAYMEEDKGKESSKYVIAQYHKLASDSMQRYEDKITELKK